jgi:hypothetical protein
MRGIHTSSPDKIDEGDMHGCCMSVVRLNRLRSTFGRTSFTQTAIFRFQQGDIFYTTDLGFSSPKPHSESLYFINNTEVYIILAVSLQ